ncbi:MAG: hypothetical protein RMJ56_15195 [Gemmataceae bacterium]|nr:hypothetical protein [Gemmata sp.]MDW8198942.1 hypothetical protein [Gemmataceae bacterium]
MLTSFVLSMALAAPVPPPAPTPAPSGPIPQLMELKPDANGKIMVMVARKEVREIPGGNAVAPGGNAPAVIKREVVTHQMVELGEVKDLTITTADGQKVELAEALKALKNGGVVVVSSDGKPVSPAHLKLFKDNVLVLVSPELVPALNATTRPGGIVRPPVRPVPPIQVQPLPAPVQPLPAPIPGNVLPAIPGGIKVQPGVIQIEIVPALPALPPAPEK